MDLTFFEFLERMKTGDRNLAFVALHGFNEFLGEMAIQSLCEHFLESKSDFNYRRFYFDAEGSASWEEIISEAKSSSFFIQARKILVSVIREEKWIGLNKSDRQLLKDYFSNPNPSAVLVLYFSLNTTKDTHKQIKKSKISPLLSELDVPQGISIDLDRISERAVTEYIKRYLKERGITITASALEKVIELKGEDYASIINQLPKFEIFQHPENSLDAQDIEKILTGIEPHSIWDLTEAIENEDVVKYLLILKYLFINGVKPTFILGTLITHYNKIYTAKFLLKHNFPVPDIGKVLQQPYFILNKFIASVKRFSERRLQRILKIIYQMDLEMKTGGEELARISLQNFIFQIKLLAPDTGK